MACAARGELRAEEAAHAVYASAEEAHIEAATLMRMEDGVEDVSAAWDKSVVIICGALTAGRSAAGAKELIDASGLAGTYGPMALPSTFVERYAAHLVFGFVCAATAQRCVALLKEHADWSGAKIIQTNYSRVQYYAANLDSAPKPKQRRKKAKGAPSKAVGSSEASTACSTPTNNVPGTPLGFHETGAAPECAERRRSQSADAAMERMNRQNAPVEIIVCQEYSVVCRNTFLEFVEPPR